MEELVAFLRERLKEDEFWAKGASPGPWRPDAEMQEVLAVDDITVAEGFALSGSQWRATVMHIARHNPARVLREIESKRRAIAGAIEYYAGLVEAEYGWQRREPEYDYANEGESLLRALALPYDDHPDYRPEWATA